MNTEQNCCECPADKYTHADTDYTCPCKCHSRQNYCMKCYCAGLNKHYCDSPECPCHHTEQKGWSKNHYGLSQAILGALEYRGFYDCGKYLDDTILEHIQPFIERTLQSQREEMVKFIKSGRIALANIGTTERPEYIFHIPEKVFDDALIKDTPQLKAKE